MFLAIDQFAGFHPGESDRLLASFRSRPAWGIPRYSSHGPIHSAPVRYREKPPNRAQIKNLTRICKEDLHQKYTMEVIDILERPRLAEDERILATPVVIKNLPPPLRRVVGDLSNKSQVIFGLDLKVQEMRDVQPVEPTQTEFPTTPDPNIV